METQNNQQQKERKIVNVFNPYAKKQREQEHEQMKKTLELIVSFLGEDFQKFKDQKSNTK